MPISWKLAKLAALLKPGKSLMALESFRPVSLTNCISKIMEKMINERLMYWIETQHVLPGNISGFRRGRCTMDSIIDLVTFVEHEKSKGNIAVAIFLDVMRAYDTASHVHILE